MYHLYQTRGFVLRSANIGEANKLLFIFTGELGLIGVRAQAVRKVESKLRYSLREYSFGRFSLVRGKTAWRLTDAEELLSFSPSKELEKIKMFASLLALVARFVHGEEENAKLFRELEGTANYLKENIFTRDELRQFETLAVLKILSSLGYIGEDRALASFIHSPFSTQTMIEFVPFRRKALQEINRALEESQL